MRRTGGIADGGEVELRVGRLAQRRVARHTLFGPGVRFRDEQVDGPFARWVHTHTVAPVDAASSELEDRIEFVLPGGRLGDAVCGGFVRRLLARVFAYRRRTLRDDLEARRRRGRKTAMKVAVTGSTGLVGHSLKALLGAGGDRVVPLVRTHDVGRDGVYWDALTGEIDLNHLAGVEAVVHLAGENIAGKRWSGRVKAAIRESRVRGTGAIARACAEMPRRPDVLVCASAVGFYGDRGDEELTEDSAPGEGFLPDVCREWEAAADPARDAGIRVVHMRFGVVLSPLGGALERMLPPFKLGVGGVLGGGRQWMPWISVDDARGAIRHAITTPSLDGAVNAVAPEPVTNREFTQTLGRVLGRPTILPMPGFVARLAFGEMAQHLLLASTRAVGRRLPASGYKYRYPKLEGALKHLLGKE